MADSLFLSTLKASRRQKYGDPDIQEFKQMFKEGYVDKIPSDLPQYIVKHRPEDDDELSLWIYECLEKQGLSCPLTRLPNTLQTDLAGTCSHLQYLSDVFFDRVGDCIVLGPRGGGKCLGEGTPVMMWDGTIKPVEQVKVGDLLMGDDSTPRTVLSTTQGFGQLYKVTPKKGDPYIVNDAHILSLKYEGNKSPKAGQVVDIPIKEYINSSQTKQTQLKGYRVPIKEFGGYSTKFSIPPYLFGVWLGDGSRHHFRITTHEAEIISYLYEVAKQYDFTIRVHPEKTKNIEYASYYFVSKQTGRGHKHPFMAYLKQHHLTESKYIPQEYKTGSWEDRLNILAGIIDTDGYLAHDGSCIEIASKYKTLAEDIAFIARSLGLACYVKERIKTCTNSLHGCKKGTYYILKIHGNTEIIPIKVQRRKPHPRQLNKNVLLTGISIEEYGQGKYYGFEIDGNRRFLLGDFTVTHNTVAFALALFLEAYFKPGIELAHLGAIEDQAKRCYRYFRKIVEHPLFAGTLAKQASGSRAEFANGSLVEILVGTVAGVNGPHCFIGSTLIDCSRNRQKYPNGVPIKELVGQKFIVPTINEYTGEVTYKKATGLYSGQLPCIEITLAKPDKNGNLLYNTVACTEQHKFLLARSHKYTYAGLLKIGDRLQVAKAVSYRHKADPKYGTSNEELPITTTNIKHPYTRPSINGISIKAGAWTVIDIKPYKNREPQDVYDIEVEGEQTTNHNYQVQGLVSHNSQHVSIDEVELMDWAVLQEAFNMARDSKGYKGATRLTSTRKKNSGTMQKIIDESDQRGLKIYKWNLWDVIETCPFETNSEGHIIDTQEPYFETDEVGNQISTMVYKSCLSCPMLAACKGQAKTSEAGNKSVISLNDAKKLYTSLDSEVWNAQVICIKPGSESMVYPMFKPELHVVDYRAGLKQKYGDDYDKIYDVEYDVYAGQDAGFICPATVFLQVIDDPETGDQLVVVFDEIYEHNIAPSKYVREFIWPKHREYNVQEYYCDPSNSAQLMAEFEEQDLYPVEGLKNVDEGIDACRAAFSLGHLLIDKHCTNLIWELNRYEKNPNTGRPIKVDDHLVDAMRYGVNGVGIYGQGVVDVIYS